MVSELEARRFAESLRINYFETSAKENLNVEQVIYILIPRPHILYAHK